MQKVYLFIDETLVVGADITPNLKPRPKLNS